MAKRRDVTKAQIILARLHQRSRLMREDMIRMAGVLRDIDARTGRREPSKRKKPAKRNDKST